jgi:glutathione peroxidase
MNLYDIALSTLDGRPATLAEHRHRALLIVNVASHCKLSSQYVGLQELHERFAPRGLHVLGFPCNQFLDREPGTPEEISAFVRANFGATFPLYEKLNVNDPDRHPLYARLVAQPDPDGQTGDIEWNFEKFLVAPGGAPVTRFRCTTTPDDPALLAAVEAQLPG